MAYHLDCCQVIFCCDEYRIALVWCVVHPNWPNVVKYSLPSDFMLELLWSDGSSWNRTTLHEVLKVLNDSLPANPVFVHVLPCLNHILPCRISDPVVTTCNTRCWIFLPNQVKHPEWKIRSLKGVAYHIYLERSKYSVHVEHHWR